MTDDLAFFVRSARYGQAPCDERGDVARPAVLNGQVVQVYRVAFQHDLLAGGVFDDFGHHAPNVFEQRQLGEGVL